MNGETGIRAYARTASGVHAVPVPQAVRLLREPDEDPAAIVWIDVSNAGEDEGRFLRDELGLHPLAVEDCLRGRQRPKLDRYPGYLFLVLYAAGINPERDRMALNELHVFLGERFLVTVHDHRVSEVAEVVARWRSAPDRFPDAGALSHLLFDVIIDDYFPVLEHYANRCERIETSVFEGHGLPDTSQILLLRHELVLFRKIVAPQRDVLSTLLRRDLPFVRPELIPYFQDVHDHIIRVAEEIDSLRELLSALLDAHSSSSANQLNQTVRMLTAWSIILMSMALVAGIYGMNFRRMPELDWRWGYPFAILMMAAVGFALVSFFRRRDWL